MLINNTFTFSGNSTRLDKYLSLQFPDIPRRFFQNEIEKGTVLVNGKVKSASYKLKEGDTIEINAEYTPAPTEAKAQSGIDFKIVFQNDDFVVIDKPAGLSVHPSVHHYDNTLVNGLLEKFPQLKNVGEDPLRPGIVHRLDKNTSGLMVVPLHQKSFSYFKSLFQNRQIEKKYQAMVWGRLKEKGGIIKTLIGRSKKNPLKQLAHLDAEKLINPKEAVTHYAVIKEFDNDTSLVEAMPKTGRKHQIRVHLAYLGHPVVGDTRYELRKYSQQNANFTRHLLHACSLTFKGPDSQEYHFESQLLLSMKKY